MGCKGSAEDHTERYSTVERKAAIIAVMSDDRWRCANCGQPSGMYGHMSNGKFSCQPIALHAEVKALRAEVTELRAQLAMNGRLGPRPETPEETKARTERMVEAITEAVAVDRLKLCTTNGKPVEEVRANQKNETGMHEGYIVLCPDERAKGFVRRYRDRYQHVGRSICGTVILPPNGNVGRWDVKICDDSVGHEGECGIVTRGVTAEQFETQVKTKHRLGGCGGVTTMGLALSETYARDPKFYGATFCCGCNRHLPVAEFVWTADGQEVGS